MNSDQLLLDKILFLSHSFKVVKFARIVVGE